MDKQRRKKGNYAERKNKDGTVSRFSIPTIRGKPKWVKIPNLTKYDGKRGARLHLEWCRKEYGGDWATETFAQSAAAHLEFIKDGKYGTYRIREQAIRLHLDRISGASASPRSSTPIICSSFPSCGCSWRWSAWPPIAARAPRSRGYWNFFEPRLAV